MKIEIVDRCDKYYNNNMSPEESEKFESDLVNDEKVKSVYRLYLKSVDSIKKEGIKRDITIIHRKMSDAPRLKNQRKLFFIIGMAACLGVIAVIGLLNNQNIGELKQSILKESEPFVDIVTMRNSDDTPSSELMALYNAGAYQEFIDSYNELENPSSSDDFYAAQAYLMIDEPDLFLELVDRISTSSTYSELIPWFKVVALSKKDVSEREIYNELLKLSEGNYKFEFSQELKEKYKNNFQD